MGVAEARFYRDLAPEMPVRVPHAWSRRDTDADDRYVMVLEDLVASGCRFPHRERRRHRGPRPRHRRAARRAARAVLGVAPLRRRRRPRVARAEGHGRRRRRRDVRADGGRQPRRPAARRVPSRSPSIYLARTRRHRCALWTARARARSCTAIRTSATSSSTATTGDRTGFLDWAVIGRSPGHPRRRVRAVQLDPDRGPARARARAGRALLRAARASRHRRSTPRPRGSSTGCSPSTRGCRRRRTAGMGSKWQPVHIGLGGTERGRRSRRVDLGVRRICWRH